MIFIFSNGLFILSFLKIARSLVVFGIGLLSSSSHISTIHFHSIRYTNNNNQLRSQLINPENQQSPPPKIQQLT